MHNCTCHVLCFFNYLCLKQLLMDFQNFTYLLLLLGILCIPLVFGIKKKALYLIRFKYFIPAILFSGSIFILWDLRFEELGIWGYNPAYLTGIFFLNLPMEKWLFFVIFPFFSVFVYEFLNEKFQSFEKPNLFLTVSLVFWIGFALFAYFARHILYTFFTFFLLTIYFGYTIFRNRFKQHYTKFYLTLVISLVPFIILKGMLIALQVVNYNDDFLLGARILEIPIEEFFQFFLLLIMILTIYEFLKKQRYY